MFDKIFLIVIGVLVLVMIGMFTVIQYQKSTIADQKTEIVNTQIERDNAKDALKVANLDIANQKAAADSLQALLDQEKQKSEELGTELQDINNAPETDNGDVAPVLRDSLERLRNRQSNQNHAAPLQHPNP